MLGDDLCTDNSTTDIGPIISRFRNSANPNLEYERSELQLHFIIVDKMWVVFFKKFGRNRKKSSHFIGFWIFLKIHVIASTLRDFGDWAKILYTIESNADIESL